MLSYTVVCLVSSSPIGRVVNGYAETDYVLANLSHTMDASWGVAGLHPVEMQSVENIQCDDVEGHLKSGNVCK
jgi:hypothetical protein